MRKFLFFSVALLTTTLLCASCQKEDVVVTLDVSTAVKSEVQTSKNLHVSYKDAIQIATEAVAMLEGDAQTRSAVKRRVDLSKVKCHITPQTRSGEGGDTLYYVVNYADSAGFALVSTTRADGDPLIAVTEQGNYTPGEETGNPGFDMYISLLNDRPSPKPEGPTLPIDTIDHGIDFIIVYNYPDTISSSSTQRGPYLTVKWTQESPYNKYCYDENNVLCPAGCVAIAVAQLMSYYERPTSFIRTHDGSNTIQPLNWDGIKLYPTIYSASETNKDALAHLIREIGHLALMDYNPGGSGAYDLYANIAMANSGYTQGTIRNYDFTTMQSELDNTRPVYMSGAPANSTSGHAWVVDGYKIQNYIIRYYNIWSDDTWEYTGSNSFSYKYLHINWGWGGNCNGYFQDGVFDTSQPYELDGTASMSRNYTTFLEMITGIVPLN